MALAAFGHLGEPPRVLNLAGPETLSVRRVALEFGRLFANPVELVGEEQATAFLSNAQESHRLLGYPRVSALQMIHWIAAWLRSGGKMLGKPTHFQVRDGKY